MSDLLRLSANLIDDNDLSKPQLRNPTDAKLHELAPGVAMIAGFSHILSFKTDAGLVLFDTSAARYAVAMRDSLRYWSAAAIDTVVYTHGHIDHVGGMQVFVQEAEDHGRARPRIIGHENVAPRFTRYEQTQGYNARINARQFSRSRKVAATDLVAIASKGPNDKTIGRFGPKHWHSPDVSFQDRLGVSVGGVDFQLRHDRGETDDHAWAWIKEHKAICAGDLIAWVFPNAGNPQKVQRYPLEWARALRTMISLEPELLLPAHGLPVGGRDRIATMLNDVAHALEWLVEHTLAMMNDGARLDQVLGEVRLPEALLDRPYLQPFYDEPEFVVRNIWRLYGGWYDGNPAHLKPAREAALSAELAALAGGARVLGERAVELAEAGDLAVACHLAEYAATAAPDDLQVHAARARVFGARRDAELSLMARGIFGDATAQSEARLSMDNAEDES